MNIENAFAEHPKLSIWQRLGFGTCACSWPGDEDGFAPGYMISGTVAVFDWKDRLRILVSGKVMMEAAIKTDVIVKKSKARSSVSVLPPDYPIAGAG